MRKFVFFLLALALAFFVGCPNPAGTAGTGNGGAGNGNGNGNGGGGTPTDPQYKTLASVITNGFPNLGSSQFIMGDFVTSSSQAAISSFLRIDIRQNMQAQAQLLEDAYAAPAAGTNPQFAATMRAWEASIKTQYSGESDGNQLIRTIEPVNTNIINAIRNLFGSDTAAANLFMQRLSAFQKSTYLGQRITNDTKTTTAQNELNGLLTQLGLANDPQAAAKIINDLIDTMPESAGPERFNILQQLEDFEQFRGWIDDVLAKGLQAVSANTNIQSDVKLAQFHDRSSRIPA
jgi:hypothetical protein